jgi:hypothetical protein
MENLETQQTTEQKRRFTTLVDNNILSQIKLISYFTNQKLTECINDSLLHYIKHFEDSNNTSIQSIIDLQSNFKPLTNNTIKKTK